MDYQVIKDIEGHLQMQDEVTLELWPEFMLHDPIANQNWAKLFEYFPEFQFSLIINGQIAATANAIPYVWQEPIAELSEEGWDWVLEKGVNDYLAGKQPNVLNGLQIAVSQDYQRQGLSSIVLKEMINLARDNGFEYVTIPVRPSLKSSYPLITIDDYIKWRREDGLPFDPWLRVHVRAGGEIVKPCHRAMYIPGTIDEWEEWTGLKFYQSGEYVVKGALSPIQVNVKEDKGEYIEPNVWVVHEIG